MTAPKHAERMQNRMGVGILIPNLASCIFVVTLHNMRLDRRPYSKFRTILPFITASYSYVLTTCQFLTMYENGVRRNCYPFI